MGGCMGKRKKDALPDVKIKYADFHEGNFVTDKLGKGAYGSVYSVSKADGEEPKYAAKVVQTRVRPDGPGSTIDMITKELQILQKVTDTNSQHVVHFIESFAEGQLVYMVMEKCDTTFREVLTSAETLTENTYRGIFWQMLGGLCAIHGVGIVHRDVKPDNFMCSGVGSQLTVKLCDFGLAGVLADKDENCLFGVHGTAPFLAPEMVRGCRYGAKADVWSFGVIVYLLLFGHFPYMPLVWKPSDMKRAIREGAPHPCFVPRVFHPDADFGDAISPEAENLAVNVLCRSIFDRPTASEAREFKFFSPCSAREGMPSLRPLLLSSLHLGAFDQPREAAEAPSDLDVTVACLQIQHGHTGAWSRQTSERSEFGADCALFRRETSPASIPPTPSATTAPSTMTAQQTSRTSDAATECTPLCRPNSTRSTRTTSPGSSQEGNIPESPTGSPASPTG